MMFSAEWCKKCANDKPKVLALRRAGVVVSILNTDDPMNRMKMGRWGVEFLPTYILHKGGGLEANTNSIKMVYKEIGV